MAILISDKVDIKSNTIKGDQEKQNILIKDIIHEEDYTHTQQRHQIYEANIDRIEKRNVSTIILGDLKISLSISDRR